MFYGRGGHPRTGKRNIDATKRTSSGNRNRRFRMLVRPCIDLGLRALSKRQRDITAKLYVRLHELERYMKNAYAGNPQSFDVHVLVDEYDRRGWITLRPKTRAIFGILRFLMMAAYAFIAYNITYDGNYAPIWILFNETSRQAIKLMH